MEETSWNKHEAELRHDWEARFGGTGLEWSEVREAHRFGWCAALRPEFADVDFAQAERDLSNHWYRPLEATEENVWDVVRDAAFEGWQAARRLAWGRAVGDD